MAGVQAGGSMQMQIEIVAAVTKLQQDMAKVDKIMRDTGQSIDRAGKTANDNFNRMSNSAAGATASAGAYRHGMQNLGFQLQDFAVQTAGGTSATRAFAQQFPQAIGAVQSMMGNTSKLGLFLGGPWGIALGVAAAALVPLINKLFETEDALKGVADQADTTMGRLNAALAQASVISNEATDALKRQLTAQGQIAQLTPKITKLTADANAAARSFGQGEIATQLFEQAAALDKKRVAAEKNLKVAKADLETVRNTSRVAALQAEAQTRLAASVEKTGESTRRTTSSTRDSAKAMTEAAKKAEEWAKALEKLRVGVAVDVSQQADTSDWMAKWEKMVDEQWQAMQDGINAQKQGAENVAKFNQSMADMERRKAFDAAYQIADILGGAWGDLVATLANAIIPLVDVTSRLGLALEAFSKGAAIGGAVGRVTGSTSGGAIGGGLASAAFEEFAGEGLTKMLGAFGGPLAGIAGGIIGGLIGGLMKSTPRASATISIIAGEAMDTAITGNKAALKKAAGQMADGVIDGLLGLADQLGAQLIGDASVSIGMRKKSYRVDPTGQGITKTSKGAIDFGDDQAAAIAYAMQVAIQQGVLGGLSESMKNLIMADGDLQTQLQKALSFKGVFDELAKRDDPAKWAQDEITRWNESMAKIFKEAGATAEELAELERLTGIKRADAAKEAADKVAEAERAAQDRQREIRDRNIELLFAQGKIEEAEAMARQARIDDAPEHLRIIQQQIEAANLLAAAEQKLLERRQAAQQIAQQFYALDERLAAAQGDDETVTRLRRENELRLATSELARTYLIAIYAAEDLATETAKAQEAFDKLAAAQKAITDEIAGLERQYLQVTGQTDALRELQLGDLLSDRARELQQSIWDYEDAMERQRLAQEAAAAAAEEYARKLESARSTLISAYERESGALQGTIDKFRDFAASIREFRAGLLLQDASPGQSFMVTQSRYRETARMAQLGNESSLGRFTGDAQAYIDAARNSARTREEYQRAVSEVMRGSDMAAKGADGLANMAQRQLDQMTRMVEQLGLIQEDNLTFQEALNQYNTTVAEQVLPTIADTISTGLDQVRQEMATAREEDRSQRRDEQAEQLAIIRALNKTGDYIDRLEHHFNGMTNRDGTVNVVVANTAANPAKVDQV